MSAGMDQYDYEIGSQKLPLNAYKLAFNIQQTNFKAHFNYFYNNKHSFDFGINSILYKLNPGNFDPNGPQSLVKLDHLQSEQGLESAVYVSDHFTVSPKFKIDAGVRFSMFNAMGPNDINVYADGIPKSENSIINTLHYDNGKLVRPMVDQNLDLVYAM